MAAGLKRHIERGASRILSCLVERQNFCVWSPGAEVKTLPDDRALLNHHGADHRIRACRSLSFRRQAKGEGHEAEILLSAGHRRVRRDVDDLRDFDGLRVTLAFFPAGFALDSAMAACAAASRAIATRKGEQLTYSNPS